MKRSRGRISKKSRTLGRKATRRRITVSDMVRQLEIGKQVSISPNSKFEDFPAPKYSGRVGQIIGKRGGAYIVEIKDGKKIKKLIASPVHFKVV